VNVDDTTGRWSNAGRGDLTVLFIPKGDRSRRPGDGLTVVAAIATLIVLALQAPEPLDAEAGVVEAMTALPEMVQFVLRGVNQLAVVWVGVVVIAAVFRRRGDLLRDLGLTILLGTGFAWTMARVNENRWPSVAEGFTGSPPQLHYPALRIAVVVAAAAATSPHLTAPYRRLFRWLTVGSALAMVLLRLAYPTGVLAGVAVGLLAAAVVHLIFGSPAGRPDLARVVGSLRSIGVMIRGAEIAAYERDGTVTVTGTDGEGPLVVKVFGRDAWDGQFVDKAVHSLLYRGNRGALALSRLQHAQHEALTNMLAARVGVGRDLVTVTTAPNDDVLLVLRADDEPMPLEDLELGALWGSLMALHQTGVSLGRLDSESLVSLGGRVAFTDLGRAEIGADIESIAADRAQVLLVGAALAGTRASLVAARAHLSDDALASVVPYIQPSILAASQRRALKDAEVDIDEVRAAAAEACGVAEPELEKLRRITWGSVLTLVMIVFVVAFVLGSFAEVDWAQFKMALEDAEWGWLVAALFLATVTRAAPALVTMGVSPAELPFGPTARIQYALPFVSIAVPTSAGRVAVLLRFQQRFGVSTPAALSAGVIDSFSGFVNQVMIVCLCLFLVRPDLSAVDDGGGLLSIDPRWILVGAVAVGVVIAVVVMVPRLRRRLAGSAREVLGAIRILRSPTRLAMILGGNLLAEIGYATALGLCARGFGFSASLGALLLVNVTVGFVAGVAPVPGGLGVAEAGLASGLVVLGADPEIALAATLAYRFCTYYLPPLPGWFVLKGLRRDGFL